MPLDLSKTTSALKKLTKREKIILYVTLSVVVLVVVDQVVVRSVMHTLSSVDKQIAEIEGEIQTGIGLLGQKDRMMKEVDFYASYAAPGDNQEDGTLVLLKEIQEAASKSSVNLVYVKPGRAEQEGSVSVFNAIFESEGSMEQLIRFLYTIENSKNLLRVEKYTVQPVSKQSSAAKCSATVSMTRIA